VRGFLGRYVPGLIAASVLAGCAGARTSLGVPVTALPAQGSRLAAGSERLLYSFTGGNDGSDPASGLVFDGRGNLYGTTVTGGTSACGTVFKLALRSSRPWQETVLHSFGCFSDGKNPYGGVTFDASGNLDGTTVAGGSGRVCSDGCGVVFQLKSSGENVLHDFMSGRDGSGPGAGVAIDPSGNLYGTTPDGGVDSEGVVYEVSAEHERVIHAFTGGSDGGTGSLGVLLRDASGSLYGVAETGGAHDAGTVFKLSKRFANHWHLTTLYAFEGTPDAASPYGGLIADAAGNLYGTTYYGGADGLGTVFELVARAHGYRERVLYSFIGGDDGSSSTSTLTFGGDGYLYGTTSAGGGSCDCGTIFKVNSKSGKEAVLHAFGGSDGAYPYYGLTRDPSGNFYGTTVQGGAHNAGTVFEYVP
jgi:uncharacterized repeat protein (TIGR03803 family)